MKDMLKNNKIPPETEMAVPVVLLEEANLLNVGTYASSFYTDYISKQYYLATEENADYKEAM